LVNLAEHCPGSHWVGCHQDAAIGLNRDGAAIARRAAYRAGFPAEGVKRQRSRLQLGTAHIGNVGVAFEGVRSATRWASAWVRANVVCGERCEALVC
jgi:hypothetical protein